MHDKPESRLLALPAELRNRIYEFVFAGGHADIEDCYCKLHQDIYKPSSSGILMACKQTNQEASDHFYFFTIFDFTSWFAAPSFLARLPPRYTKLISNLRLDTVAYFRESGICVDNPISCLAEYTQGCLFDMIHQLKRNGCPIPTKTEVCIRDWRVPEGPLTWTTDPWKTFVEIYGDIPDREKGRRDQSTIVKYRDYFNRTHGNDSECWYRWGEVIELKQCDCPRTQEDNKDV